MSQAPHLLECPGPGRGSRRASGLQHPRCDLPARCVHAEHPAAFRHRPRPHRHRREFEFDVRHPSAHPRPLVRTASLEQGSERARDRGAHLGAHQSRGHRRPQRGERHRRGLPREGPARLQGGGLAQPPARLLGRGPRDPLQQLTGVLRAVPAGQARIPQLSARPVRHLPCRERPSRIQDPAQLLHGSRVLDQGAIPEARQPVGIGEPGHPCARRLLLEPLFRGLQALTHVRG